MLAIKNGNLLMSGGKLVKGNVLIEGGTIKAVGERAVIPSGTKVIDAAGKTVMPGLIDAHTHLTVYQDPALLSAAGAGKAIMRGAFLARQALRAGITTMRDMGGFCFTDIDLRNAIAAGQVPGPRLLCSGKVISTTGGHIFYVSREADGPDEVRKAAREQIKMGADFIKVMCSGGVERVDESINAVQLNMDEIRAAVGVAQDNGTVVAAHAHPKRAMKEALLAGVTSIEHGSLLDEEVAEIMLKKKAFIVPTFSVYAAIANLGLPGLSERAKFVYEEKKKSFKIVLKRGVRWGVGTDSGAFSPMSSIVDELVITHSLGVSAVDVLHRVTAGNAELIGLKDTGTLAAGKRADIVIVDGNPLRDLESVRRVSFTIANGVAYDWSAVP
jgi:imidazolonepropionase-like amidohydrolase